VSARRPVRTQKIAYEETPLNAANPDIDARMRWLLAMSRLHHLDESFQDGRRFAESLAAVGFPANRSLLSRWESGEISIRGNVGLRDRTRPGDRADLVHHRLHQGIDLGLKMRVVRPKLDPDTRAFADRLNELE